MRRKLTLTTVAAAAIAVLVLGLPMAVAVRPLIIDLSLRSLQSEAQAVATIIGRRRIVPVEVVDQAFTDLAAQTGSEVALVNERGQFLAATRDFSLRSVNVLGSTDRGYVDGRLHVIVPTTVFGQRVDLHVDAPPDEPLRRVRQAWLAIAVVSATALLVAAAVGSWQARLLARPLEQLATVARRLGDGDFSARAPRSGLPEPDMVAVALDSTAERLGVLVDRAQSFSADASHQLRTPLTAVRLHVESLAFDRDNDALVDEALAELDRLDATIGELLALGSSGAAPEICDPIELVTERLTAWTVLAENAGRSVTTAFAPTPPIRVRPGAVGQALQVLLDNALLHGKGAISVVVAPAGRPDSRWVHICVVDEGSGFNENTLPPRVPVDRGTSGRGLVLARSLMAAEGGLLRVEPVLTGTRVCLLVPAPLD